MHVTFRIKGERKLSPWEVDTPILLDVGEIVYPNARMYSGSIAPIARVVARHFVFPVLGKYAGEMTCYIDLEVIDKDGDPQGGE